MTFRIEDIIIGESVIEVRQFITGNCVNNSWNLSGNEILSDYFVVPTK